VCCACYVGEASAEVKIEADSNDITDYPHYDQPGIGTFYSLYLSVCFSFFFAWCCLVFICFLCNRLDIKHVIH